ncbi:hypothetical protein [Paenibacillus sp. BJ-4]|uniref:hypothetical protein n=1 Tax=Paenibacillus sp. BJ-4 TaxID=2878097 RepID=UPI001CF0C612|nr:hypothetical protein [Paenibacillus sp. BJ-4]
MKTNENRNGIPVSAKRGLRTANEESKGRVKITEKAHKSAATCATQIENNKRKIFKGV